MSHIVSLLSAEDAGQAHGYNLEPVSAADVMRQCRIDEDSDDYEFISGVIIPASRQLAETKTGSAIRLARYKQSLASFPAAGVDNVRMTVASAPFYRNGRSLPVFLSHGNINSVESIDYIDASGSVASIDLDTVEVIRVSDANVVIQPIAGVSWPQSSNSEGAIEITYVAGMLPDELNQKFPSVRQWILLACGWAYSQREMFYLGRDGFSQMPSEYTDGLLDPLRVAPRF